MIDGTLSSVTQSSSADGGTRRRALADSNWLVGAVLTHD